MRKQTLLMMAGLAILTFTATQASAFDIDGDMGEGLSLSVEQSTATYKYDSRNSAVKESMTEFDFFPEEKATHPHFAGDPSCPEMHDLMGEGICMDSLQKSVAAK